MPTMPAPLQFQTPRTVRLAEEERTTGIITDEHVAEAVSAVHRDGLVVLENAVDKAHCDELNGILCAEAEVMAKLPTTHFNDVSFHRTYTLTLTRTFLPFTQHRHSNPTIPHKTNPPRTQSTASPPATCPKGPPSPPT